MLGIGIDVPSRLNAQQDRSQAQEALAFRGLGMASANPGEGQVHYRASGVADEPQSLGRREPPPRIDLALLDVGGRVGRENRHRGRGRGLDHCAIIEPANLGERVSSLDVSRTSRRFPRGHSVGRRAELRPPKIDAIPRPMDRKMFCTVRVAACSKLPLCTAQSRDGMSSPSLKCSV